MKARIISTEDNKSNKTQIFEEPSLTNTIQTCESLECLKDSSIDILKKINDNISAKESKEFNGNEVCLTLSDSHKTLIAEDIKSTSRTEQHLKEAGISLQEYLPQNGGDLNQKKWLTDSKDDTSVLQGKEEEKWSLTTNRNQEPYNEIETTLSPKTESVQLTENLDDNANPNTSNKIVDASYFSIYNEERMKDENNQFPENKKINRCFFNKAESSQLEQDYSTISLNQKYTAPVVSEDPDKKDEQSFLRSPEAERKQPSLDAAHDCKIFKNTVSDQVAFSCNACLDNQGQIKDINDEKTSKAKRVTTTFSFPCDTTDDTSNQGSLEVLFENKITKKEIYAHTNDSQTVHLQKSKQCYISTFNVSEESQIFESPLITSNTPLTSQDQDDKDKARVVDTPDLKIRSKLDCPVHTTDRAESTENQLTMGEKVIIALVTEETSEREICIPVPYIDVCTDVSKNTVDQEDTKIGVESESQKVSDNLNKGQGGRNIESEEITNTPLDDMKVLASIKRDGDNGQMQRTTTAKMPGADAIYMGAYNVFKDQFKSNLDDFSNNITTVEESDSQMTDNSHTESSNSLCAELSGNFSKLVKEQGDTIDNSIISGSTTDMSGMLHAQENTEQNYLRPSILISEPDDELERWCNQDEEKSEPEDMNQCYYYSETNQQTQTGEHEMEDDSLSSDPLNFSKTSSKVICSVMFVVFSGLMYHYDFLVCFALYLFSLYWLYWDGDGNKKSVKKE